MNNRKSINEMSKIAKGLTEVIDLQELGTMKFFLMTNKPVVTTSYEQFVKYKDYFKDYPILVKDVLTQDKKEIAYQHVIIAKNNKLLKEYLKTEKLPDYMDRYAKFGELYGFPKTAIDYFLAINENGDRYHVRYYGLGFICKRDDIKQIEKELLDMYGLPLISKYFKTTEA